MKISIVIPCYNCSETITETLDSVINNGFDNIEIILINDGSSDDTKNIIEQYAKEHTHDIKVINQENAGVCCARNKGIEESTGDFIIFLDSDDILAPGYLELCEKVLSDNEVDVAYCQRTYGIDIVKNIESCDVSFKKVDGTKMMRDLLYNKKTFSFCCFTYKSDILKKNKVLFSEGAKYGEDWEFATKYLAHCKNGMFMDCIGFYFRILSTSVSRNIVYNQTDVIGAAQRASDYLKVLGHPMYVEFNTYQPPKAVFSVAHRFAAAGNKVLFNKLLDEYDVKKSMKELLAYKKADLETKIMASLFNISPKIFYVVCKIHHNISH